MESADIQSVRIDVPTARTLGNLIAISVAVGVAGIALITFLFPQVPIAVLQFTAVVAVAAAMMVAVIWAAIAVSLSIRMRLDRTE